METNNNTNDKNDNGYSEYMAIWKAKLDKHEAVHGKRKPENQIEGHMWGTDGRHYDVIAQVEVVIYDHELDYATITGIEICDSEEPLQSNVLKVNGLHEIPGTHFSKKEVDGLESRMSEEAFQRDYSQQQDAMYDSRRDEEGHSQAERICDDGKPLTSSYNF